MDSRRAHGGRARVEQAGIIFIDEIDKIAGREGSHGPDVSREGVQRDILPIVEGTTVNTKRRHGPHHDHILFIAAGARSTCPNPRTPHPPSCYLGPLPIDPRRAPRAPGRRSSCGFSPEPRSALVKQYIALMETEGIALTFTSDAIHRIADFATIVNERTENIGARRLHTVMEKLLDEISFEGPDLVEKRVVIDDAYVNKMLADIVKNEDLSRYNSVKAWSGAGLAPPRRDETWSGARPCPPREARPGSAPRCSPCWLPP